MIEINLSSIDNIRDLGDTVTIEGKTVARNRFIRSAVLANAVEEDLEYLKREHHLDTVLDLRSSSDAKERPDRISDLNYLNIPIFEKLKNAVSEEQILAHEFPEVTGFMTSVYVDLMTDPDYTKGIAKAVKAIMEHAGKDGAILFHCSEGKDRTGIISAILLRMLGVSDETIMQDYMFTNKTAIHAAEAIYQQALEIADEEIADCMYLVCLANEKYLQAALEIMDDGFIKDVLEIDDAAIEEFRNNILI